MMGVVGVVVGWSCPLWVVLGVVVKGGVGGA